ncbi:MAG: hydantoinase B/oxoprolinase family protein [Thermoleophilia bacterium]|nr:hydantoinase B/oxoprolinase family protein [Thermoleophilia bacterium]
MTSSQTSDATEEETKTIDGVLLAVLANRMESVVREMTNTLLRSGRSAVLNTARDFSCSLITSENELLASAEGLPVHVIGTELLAKAMTELHPEFSEGDAYLHNDPYLGNTHAADHAILVPVFYEGEHVFTACAKAHQADCGNALPTTYMPGARDVYEEGALIFPCVTVQRDYQDNEDIIRMCRRRIRVPEQWYGDYLATLGAARIAERRLKDLCAKYGLETVRAFVREWFDYSERRITQAIQELPTAEVVGSATHDPYVGVPDGIPLKVEMSIDGEGGRIEIDLRDNPDNYPGGLNESQACATNNVITGVFNSIDPDVPHNAGSFRRISVKLREGCVAGIPEFPHSCSMATTNVADRLVCLTQAAFATLGEGLGLAEGGLGMGISYGVISGKDERYGGAPYINQIFLGSTGGPGGPEADGWPTYYLPVAASLMYHDSTEIDEQKYPLQVWEKRLIRDSAGAGRQRGGLGSKVIYSCKNEPMTVAYSVDGHENPPRGVRGGKGGKPADAWKLNEAGDRTDVEMVDAIEIEPNVRLVSITPGGGGYGDPLTRAPALVCHDVSEGWVSEEEARSSYGVVLVGVEAGRQRRQVDEDATRHLREALEEDLHD